MHRKIKIFRGTDHRGMREYVRDIIERGGRKSMKRFMMTLRAAVRYCDLRKAVATATLACFLVSSVGGQALAFIAGERRIAAAEHTLEDAGIPPALGRVSETYDAGSDRAVVVIQDLHCHGEVQKNIGQLLRFLDEKFTVSRVYQEGVAGNADTAWLTAFKDRKLGSEVIESLLEHGELTGAEYFAVSSRRHDLIAGLENEALYNANVLRLDRAMTMQAETGAALDVLKERYARLKKTYCGTQNLRLEKTVQAYRDGRLDNRKYYSLLQKFGVKARVDIYSYGNIVRYLEVIARERELNYPAIAGELQRFLGSLKRQLPYNDYQALLERTGNFTRVNELYRCLGEVIRRHGLADVVAADFPHLAAFLAYLDASREIDPLVLLKEEKKLLRELQAGLAVNDSERETAFLGNFLKMLEDYFSNQITADDYRYFTENLPRFRFLWEKYADADDLASLRAQFDLMTAYYQDNLERNRWFVKNTLGEYRFPDAQTSRSNEAFLASLKEPIVAVMGGFHTAGYTDLLKERKVSYVVITPNATQGTEASERVYNELMELQARVLTQTLAARALSADPWNVKEQKVASASLRVLLSQGMRSSEITVYINALLRDMDANAHFTLSDPDAHGNYRFEITAAGRTTSYYFDAVTGRESISGTSPAVRRKGARGVLHGLGKMMRHLFLRPAADVWVSQDDTGMNAEEDRRFMREALAEAEKASKVRPFFSARVGAVLVKEGRVIGRGFNKPNSVFHAEQQTVIDALRGRIDGSVLPASKKRELAGRLDVLLTAAAVNMRNSEERNRFFQEAFTELTAISGELDGGETLRGITLYATYEPCRKCTSMINQLGFGRVVFGMHAVAPYARGVTVFRNPGIKLTGGVLASDAEHISRGYLFMAGRFPRFYQAWQELVRGVQRLLSLAGQRHARDDEGSELAVQDTAAAEPETADADDENATVPQEKKDLIALGLNPKKVLKTAAALNPALGLGQFLQQPALHLADILVPAGMLEREEFGDAVAEKVTLQLQKALAQRAGELGFGKDDRVEIKTFTLLPKELADREANILATLGIETVKEPSGNRHTVIFTQHIALKTFILDSIRNNSPPPGFRSVDAFIKTVAEHELDEYLAVNVPGSAVGRQFTQYLAAELLKLDLSGIPDGELPARVADIRDSGHFHDFIMYAAGLPKAKRTFNALQQRKLLQAPGAVVEDYYRKLISSVDAATELAPGVFGTVGKAFAPDSDRPLVAVFDAHGTLLQPSWKDEYAVAYRRLTKKSDEEARQWVEKNGLFVSDDEVVRLLAKDAGVPEEEARRQRVLARNFIRKAKSPEAIAEALEFVRSLHEKGVTIVVTSGSQRTVVLKQLRKTGFLDIIPEEMVIGLDDIILSTPQLRKSKYQYRNLVLESLRRHFPGYSFIYFNDGADGFTAARKAGGITVGVPQGEGAEFRHNMQELLNAGADIVLAGWKHWRAFLDSLGIVPLVQQESGDIPVFEERSTEVPVVIPARRESGQGPALHIEVSDDLGTLTYSAVDDAGVYRADGTADYSELKTVPGMTHKFPSSYLLSPERYMKQHFTGKEKELLDVWSQGRRYTTYRGITVSWDRKFDKNVWTTNIDTLYLHRALEESGLLDNKNIKRVIEIGTGGGHISTLLAARVANLEEITITDISLYALRTAKRNIIPYLKERPGRFVRLRAYLGKGVGTIKGGKADLIVVNPPYIPTPDSENDPHTDPYRGTGLIRELLDIGIEKLNPNNPDASLILNISSMADKKLQEYFAEFGDRFTVEKMGEPLKVPLKITAVNDNWKKWLVDNGLLEDRGEVAADEERFWHTLTVYRITPKPGVVKSWSAKKKDRIKGKIYTDTRTMLDTFAPLLSEQKDESKEKELEALFPEVYGYLSQSPDEMNFDYQAAPEKNGRNLSLVRHIFERGFGRKLLGLEKNDLRLFQDEPGISRQEFEKLSGIVRSLKETDILPYVRAAFLYHDIAKARPPKLWKEWEKIDGIDLRIPNKAAALILRNKRSLSGHRKGLFENIDLFGNADSDDRKVLNELFYRLIETRGNAGQLIRGETTYDVFEDFTKWIQSNLDKLAPALGVRTPAEAAERVTEITYLFNVLDAASTREGLLTSRVNGEFTGFYRDFLRVITPVGGTYPVTWNGILNERWQNFRTIEAEKAYIKDRLGRFRQERREVGEPVEELDRVIDALAPESAVNKLFNDLRHFQGWYVESATFGFSAETQVKIIALAMALAEKKKVNMDEPFHINFFNFMRELSTGRHEFDLYKTRIVETVLRDISLEDLLLHSSVIDRFDREDLTFNTKPVLGGAGVSILDGRKSMSFNFYFSEEGKLLLPLLHLYEMRDSVKFHKLLNLLLNTYGILKDKFDRVSNEISYLATMARSRNDKLRLLEYGKGAVWVEVGPGDGRTLMDIAKTFRETKGIQRIVGVELSEEVFKALQRVIKEKGLPVEAIKGDASKLSSILEREHIPAPSTIIFCSMLHEVFSYTEKDGRQFNIDSVRDLMRSALAALEPGGRILIRDGVLPDDGEETQILELTGEKNKDVYDYYVENFKGRDLSYAPVILHKDDEDPDNKVWRVRIKRKDAMEFLYTLTWCYKTENGKDVFEPSSLPYEVREQYGVLKRGEYIAMLQEVGKELGFAVQEVPQPDDEKSYLQPGYEEHLKGRARLLNEQGQEVKLPPSNMMIVVEKGVPLQQAGNGAAASIFKKVQALGANIGQVVESAAQLSPLLADYLKIPSIDAAEKLIGQGFLRNEPALVVTSLIDREVRKVFAGKANVIGVRSGEVSTRVVTLLPGELAAGPQESLLATMGMETAVPGKGNGTTVIFTLHKVLKDYLEDGIRNNSPPEGFTSLEEFIGVLVRHEFDEYLALHVPDSDPGRSFMQYLATTALKVDPATLPPEALARLIDGSDLRTADNYHAYLRYEAGRFGSSVVAYNEQRRLLDFVDHVWFRGYEELADSLVQSGILNADDRQFLDQVTRYYLNFRVKEHLDQVNDMALALAQVPGIEAVYGVGFPFYGNVDIRRRIYLELLRLDRKEIDASKFRERIFPDIDLLTVYEDFGDEGPWYVQPEMDLAHGDNFVMQYNSMPRWQSILKQFREKYGVLTSFNERSLPLEEFKRTGRVNHLDLLPIPLFLWNNIPYFVKSEDSSIFYVIQDILFTTIPLAGGRSLPGKRSVPEQFRLNFLLNVLEGRMLSEQEVLDDILEHMQLNHLMEMYPVARQLVADRFREAIARGMDRGLLEKMDGKYALSGKGRRYLDAVLERRAVLVREGFLEHKDDLPADETENDQGALAALGENPAGLVLREALLAADPQAPVQLLERVTGTSTPARNLRSLLAGDATTVAAAVIGFFKDRSHAIAVADADSRYLRQTLRKELSGENGIAGYADYAIDIAASDNPALVKNDAWVLSTIEVNHADRRITLYVHELLLKALPRRGSYDRRRLLGLLARHEAEEYLSLNDYASPLHRKAAAAGVKDSASFHVFLRAYDAAQLELLDLAFSAVSERFPEGELATWVSRGKGLLREIRKELSGQTSAKLPLYAAFSDIHGSYERLLQLVSYALGSSQVLSEQQIIEKASKEKGLPRILILGDLFDRGPDGMSVFHFTWKLLQYRLGDYVTGNHDLLAMMNLLGVHLPSHEDYEGITDDYEGYRVGRVRELLVNKHREAAPGVKDPLHWAAKIMEYMAYADQGQEKRWKNLEQELAGHFDRLYGYDLEQQDVLTDPVGIFSDNEEVRRWWGKVLGYNVGVRVYTGARAVDKMSINWWEDRRREIEGIRGVGTLENTAAHWDAVTAIIDNIIAVQKKKMDEELERGNWEWAVIDAIMYRNYESVEWYALDWVYHDGWGSLKGGLLSEINKQLKDQGVPQTDLLTNGNYLRYPDLVKLRDFYIQHFSLYRKDEYGTVYTHAFLPLDDEGDVSIGRYNRKTGAVEYFEKDGTRIKGLYYKGRHYRGRNIFKAFDAIAEDIHAFGRGERRLSEIHEAFALMYSIYADNTTRIKPEDLLRYKGIGFGTALDKIGVTRLVVGHNPANKLEKSGIKSIERDERTGEPRLFHIDYGMSPKYEGWGGYFSIDRSGMAVSHMTSKEREADLLRIPALAWKELLLSSYEFLTRRKWRAPAAGETDLTMAGSEELRRDVAAVAEFYDPAFVFRLFGVRTINELPGDAQRIEDTLKEQGMAERLSALFTFIARKVKKGELEEKEAELLKNNVDHTIRVYAAFLQLYNLAYTADADRQIRLARLYAADEGGESGQKIIETFREILKGKGELYNEKVFLKWAFIALFHDIGKYEENLNLREAYHDEIGAELLERAGILETLEGRLSRQDIREIFWIIRTHLTIGTQAPAARPVTALKTLFQMEGFSDEYLGEDGAIDHEKFNKLLDASLLFWLFDAAGINHKGAVDMKTYRYLSGVIEDLKRLPANSTVAQFNEEMERLARRKSEERMTQMFAIQGINWNEFRETAETLIKDNKVEGVTTDDWTRFLKEFYHVSEWWRFFSLTLRPFRNGDAITAVKGLLLFTRAALDPAFGPAADEIRTTREDGFMPASPEDQEEYGGQLSQVIRQAAGIAAKDGKIYFTGAGGNVLPGVEITKQTAGRMNVRIEKDGTPGVRRGAGTLKGTAAEAMNSADPLKDFFNRLLHRFAATTAEEWLRRSSAPLPELAGRTIFRYIPLRSGTQLGADREREYENYFKEAAAMTRSGIATVMLLPVVPDGFEAVGSKIEVGRGQGRLAHAYAGTIGVDGGKVGVIAIDGMTGEDMFEFYDWLNEQPEKIKEDLAASLGIAGKLQGPYLTELKGTPQDLEAWLNDEALRRLEAMPVERRPHIIYRGELSAAKNAPDQKRLAALDSIVDERRYGFLTEEQRVEALLTDVYQPAAIRSRKQTRSPAVARGTLVGVSMIRGSDMRRDSGIGELPDIDGYYARQVRTEGPQSLLFLPLSAPKENSPFESIDLRSGDELLVGLSALPEVQRLLKKGVISSDELYGGYRDLLDRQEVFTRKFSLMLKLLPFIRKEAGRNAAYRAFLQREASWLDGYAAARATVWSRKDPGVKVQDAAEIFKYLQWLFDRQFREAVGNVHLRGGQMQVWVDMGKDNYEEALGAIQRYLDYGLDDIVVRFTDASALTAAHLESIKAAAAEYNPYATVALRRPENAALPAEVLKLLADFKRVVYFSEAAMGEPVTGNDIVIMDPPESAARPHAGVAGDIRALYLSMLEKVREAGTVVFTLGDLEGDDVTIANGGRWDYRMPADSEVREKRARSDMSGFGREVAERLQSFEQNSRAHYYARGLAAGGNIAAAILADDSEMAVLREPLTVRPLRLLDNTRKTVASFDGNGLFAVLDAYRWMKAAGEKGEEVLKVHSADGDNSLFSMALPLLKELAGREGPNRSFWTAVMSEGRNLELHRDLAGDMEEKIRYSEELAGMLEGVAEKILENRDARMNGAADTKADRKIRTSLLRAAESIVFAVRDSDNRVLKAGIVGNPLYGTERASSGVEAIRALLSFGRYQEARAAISATVEELQRKGMDRSYAAVRDLLEFTALLGVYARNTDELPENARQVVEKRLKALPRDSDGLLIVGPGDKPVEIEALYYNALKVTGDAAAAGRVRNAVGRNYRDLWTLQPADNERITSGALYLLALDGAADLVPADGKRRLLEAVALKLKDARGIRGSVKDPVSSPGLVGLYADALQNVLLGEGAGGLRKLRAEKRKLINPLLAVYLEKRLIPSREGRLSDPQAIADLYRIFDALYNPRIPALLDPEKAFKGALDTFDTRYIGRIRSAA